MKKEDENQSKGRKSDRAEAIEPPVPEGFKNLLDEIDETSPEPIEDSDEVVVSDGVTKGDEVEILTDESNSGEQGTADGNVGEGGTKKKEVARVSAYMRMSESHKYQLSRMASIEKQDLKITKDLAETHEKMVELYRKDFEKRHKIKVPRSQKEMLRMMGLGG